MAIVIDSNSPYYEDFTKAASSNAVYLTGHDPLFGGMLSVIYQSSNAPAQKLSSLLISSHGTSGFVDMTLTDQSRYYSAVNNLPPQHKSSLVRQALAVSSLRSFATMDGVTRDELEKGLDDMRHDWDETMAGFVASKMQLVTGRYPDEVGDRIRDLGLIEAKTINTALLDVVYVDSDSTIDKNNELVYLLGHQLEQLFDPLSEYSPEPTERLYAPPVDDTTDSLDNDTMEVQAVIEELFSLQTHFKTNLINFLQDFLIPLRVQVLGNEMGDDDMTIRKLNTIFPPTIDEIVRINNIFFEALQQALPYGSFEVMKACGMTIPYFYKACMRHKAATRNFVRNLKEHYTLFRQHLPGSVNYTPRMIESTVQCSLHLARIKLVLERLMRVNNWSDENETLVKEFYNSAVGTIDAFGRETAATTTAYDRRVFTPTGKVLVEIATGWPKELEYGWINRRVVTIFDAVDVMTEAHHIVLIFTDQFVILKPKEPIPMVSASGMHLPSIADILMHSMVNEMPLQSIPELQVVAWAPIETIIMSEYNKSQNLCVSIPEGIKINGEVRFQQFYQLVRSDHDAGQFVAMLSKAQVMNKTQPFHLFKNSTTQMSVYATVHELQGYAQEVNKTPIALFMNVDVTRDILKANNLSACLKVEFESNKAIRVQAFSSMGCGEFDRVVGCEEFAKLINQETAYLYSLHYSSKNKAMLPSVINANRMLTKHLIEFASSKTSRKREATNRRPIMITNNPSCETVVSDTLPFANLRPEPKRRVTPMSIFYKLRSRMDHKKQQQQLREANSLYSNLPTSPNPDQEQEQEQEAEAVPDLTRSDSSSSEDVFEFPLRNNSMASDEWEDVTDDMNTTASSIGMSALRDNANVVVIQGSSSSTCSSAGSLTQRTLNRPVSMDNAEMASTDVDSVDERRQQHDVEEWFKDYESSIDQLSLSSSSEFDDEDVSYRFATTPRGANRNSEIIEQDVAVRQLAKMFHHAPHPSDSFMDADESVPNTVRSSRILSELSPAYHKSLREISSSDSLSTVNVDDDEDDRATLNIDNDFNHLAGFWNDTMNLSLNEEDNDRESITSREEGMVRSTTKLWPDLRDPSIMFLGSFVHSRNASVDIKEEEEPSGVSSLDFNNNNNEPSEGEWMAGTALPNSLNNILRFSSATTLQLASFTVELDQLIEQDEANGWHSNAAELQRVKQVIISQYEHTRNLLSSDVISYEQEEMSRAKVRQLTWTVINMAGTDPRYFKVVQGVLQMENLRRLKLADKNTIV